MKLDYKYNDMTLQEFLSKSSNDIVVNGFGTMSIEEDGRLYKVLYVEILGSDCRFVLKFDDDEVMVDKDKKIENLRAVIAKNYKKIENQANEITLLIQQKEDLKATLEIANEQIEKKIDAFERQVKLNKHIQDKLNIANNTVALQIEENSKLNAKLSHLDRVVKSLSEQIIKKDGIIEYLEGKLCEN